MKDYFLYDKDVFILWQANKGNALKFTCSFPFKCSNRPPFWIWPARVNDNWQMSLGLPMEDFLTERTFVFKYHFSQLRRHSCTYILSARSQFSTQHLLFYLRRISLSFLNFQLVRLLLGLDDFVWRRKDVMNFTINESPVWITYAYIRVRKATKLQDHNRTRVVHKLSSISCD